MAAVSIPTLKIPPRGQFAKRRGSHYNTFSELLASSAAGGGLDDWSTDILDSFNTVSCAELHDITVNPLAVKMFRSRQPISMCGYAANLYLLVKAT